MVRAFFWLEGTSTAACATIVVYHTLPYWPTRKTRHARSLADSGPSHR